MTEQELTSHKCAMQAVQRLQIENQQLRAEIADQRKQLDSLRLLERECAHPTGWRMFPIPPDTSSINIYLKD